MASSKDDLSTFPNDVKTRVGARSGMRRSPQVAGGKPLKGFGDAGVLEVVADFDGSTFRTVYTVRFAKAVYVLHVFQRNLGVRLPRRRASWISLETRLARAKENYEAWLKCR